MRKTLQIAVPPGIGDSLWSLTKIPAILREEDCGKCVIIAKNTELNRSADFLRHFDFVDDARYENFPIHPPTAEFAALAHRGFVNLIMRQPPREFAENRMVAETGEYIYLESCRNFMGRYDWLLIANGHLERGKRLETWLPQFATDFLIGVNNFKFTSEELESAELIHAKILGGAPFVVFYLGPKKGNTTDGHNRNSLWTLADWREVARLMKEFNPELEFVITGAEYDLDYAFELEALATDMKFHNLVGSTRIGVTFALLKRARFVLSYQSGIGIFSVYLGIPTGCFWRPYGDSLSSKIFLSFREEMASAWAPPWSLGERGNYLPLIYTRATPRSIVDECVKRCWI